MRKLRLSTIPIFNASRYFTTKPLKNARYPWNKENIKTKYIIWIKLPTLNFLNAVDLKLRNYESNQQVKTNCKKQIYLKSPIRTAQKKNKLRFFSKMWTQPQETVDFFILTILGLQLYWKTTPYWCFPVNTKKFFRTATPQSTCKRLLLVLIWKSFYITQFLLWFWACVWFLGLTRQNCD